MTRRSGRRPDFHGLIHGPIAATWAGRGGTPRDSAKSLAGSFDVVGVAVAAGLDHGQRAAEIKLLERSVGAVLSLISALGLRDGDQIIFYADDIDGLRGRACSCGLQVREI